MSVATNVLGFGTAFRGRFELANDGSYITTQWLVVGGLAVVPLSCWRHNPRRGLDDGVSHVPYQDETRKVLFAGDTTFRDNEHHPHAERIALRWRYVGKQLLCSLGLMAWLIAALPVFRLIIALNTVPRPGAAFGLLIGYFAVFPFLLTYLISAGFDKFGRGRDA